MFYLHIWVKNLGFPANFLRFWRLARFGTASLRCACPGGPDISTWARSEQISRRPKMGKIEKLCLIQKQLPSMIVTKSWKTSTFKNFVSCSSTFKNSLYLSLFVCHCLPVSLSIHFSDDLSPSLSIYVSILFSFFFSFFVLSLSRPIYLAVCLYTYPSMNVYMYIYIYFFYLFIHLSVYPSTYLAIYLPT
jgi:hypothetical protein